jgi:hypothetical protein
MRKNVLKLLKSHSDRLPQRIFWPNELAQFLSTHRNDWGMPNVAIEELLETLLQQKIMVKSEFTSNRYDAIIRYVRGEQSVEELALSLQRDSFLSHGTALTVHKITPPGKVIYVNREQSPKNQSGEITQGGIRLAFRNKQRQSQYVFSRLTMKYMLLSGKHTGRAGVRRVKISGEQLDATDIERTLIDVVVRPAYAGGIENVAGAYLKVVNEINVDYMIDLLREVDHAYPYHQAIGFLLERAGRTTNDCEKFLAFGQQFDFYLDYRIKNPTFNQKWRLYYPPSLDKS